MDKNTTKLCYQELHKPTHKFVRSANLDGVVKIALDDSVEGPVLTPANLKVCTSMLEMPVYCGICTSSIAVSLLTNEPIPC